MDKYYIKKTLKSTDQIQYHSKNSKGKDYIVGDIHGCYSDLEKSLTAINFDKKKDRLFCAGDLVDRGPESHLVNYYLNQDWFFSVRGNHDYFVVRAAIEDKAFSLDRWYEEMSGGNWWKNIPFEDQLNIANELAKLPTAIELETHTGKIGIVHAYVPFNMTWQEYCKELKRKSRTVIHDSAILRTRAIDYSPKIEGIDKVYFGHVVFPEITYQNNSVFLDTGSSYQYYSKNSVYYREKGHLSIIEIQ